MILRIKFMVPVNYVAVAIAAVLAMVVGSVWYSKALFGKQWMKLTGVTEESAKKGNMPMLYKQSLKTSFESDAFKLVYGTMFAAALVEALVLAHFIHYAGAYSLVNGIKTGVWAWLGFVVTTSLANSMFEGRPRELLYINAGYALVNLMIMGAVIALVR